MESTPRITLSQATIAIAVFSLLSRLVGLLRDRLLASHFGAGDVLDVYIAAFRIPDFLYNLLILGTLSAAFIPVFTESAHKNREAAWRLARSIFYATAGAMGLLSALLALLAPQLTGLLVPGFPAGKQQLVVGLTRIMLFSPFFFSLSSVFSSVLNSFRRFVVVAALPVIYNLGIIGGIIFLQPRFGLAGLAWGVVLGAFLHMLLQIPAARQLGFEFTGSLAWRSAGVRQVLRTFLPRVFGMDVSQISFFVSSIFGSMLAPGSVAVYALAFNLQALPLGIIAVAFATVAFTLLSEAAAAGDREKFQGILQANFIQILFLVVPLGILLLVLRAQIVRIILGAGHFTWNDTLRTVEALGYFAISLFAQCLIPLFSRAFYALKNTLTPVLCGFAAAVVNVAGAILLVPKLGVAGLALSFSLASFVNLLLLFVALEVKIGNIVDAPMFLKLEKIAVAATVSGIGTYIGLFAVEPFVNTATVLGLVIQTLLAGLTGIAGYLGAGAILNLSESRHLITSLKVWLNRLRMAFAKVPGIFQ